MIVVSISTTDIIVDGHAGYAEQGKDIICSAVSVLTFNLIKSIESLTKDKIRYQADSPGHINMFDVPPDLEYHQTKLGEEFDVFKDYDNNDVKLSFVFSKGGMEESESKQRGNYDVFAKMFSCFDDVIESAIGIEVHNRNKEGYKPDPTLEEVYVLVSAFENGESIVPVKLEIKEFNDKKNTLYVAIALESIKKDKVLRKGDTQKGVTQVLRLSMISLADLFKNINPSDETFLKYVPKQFLETNDIHYSDRINDSVYDVMGENARVESEDTRIKEDVERLEEYRSIGKKEGNFTLKESQLKSVAKHFLNISNSKYSELSLVEDIGRLYKYLATTPKLMWNDVTSRCYEVADKILAEQSKARVETDYFSGVLKDIRRESISLSEEQIAEAKKVYGDNYRNAYLGRIVISKNGISMDQKWNELSQK